MRFLADESCDAALGRSLLQVGHDVLEVRAARPGADDEWVVSLAVSENRILLALSTHQAINTISNHRNANPNVEILRMSPSPSRSRGTT